VNVSKAEFPVLVRLINALEEPLSLLLFRQVKEEFDDLGAVTVEMLFQVHDGTISLPPDGFLVAQFFRKPLTAQNFRMHPNDEHFLVIGTIEDADLPAFGKPPCCAPEKIMFQLVGARLFETENLAASRIDPGHDVANGPVLAGGIHALKNRNCSGRSVGQTSGLPVSRASGPEFRRHQVHGAGGSVNRQTGGLPHT
jgi:hypothetical protein